MAPLYNLPAIGCVSPTANCFYFYLVDTNIGLDGNWYNGSGGYQITTDITGISYCSFLAPSLNNDGIFNYAAALGINGCSDIWLNSSPASIGGLLSYYGPAANSQNYNFIFTNTLNQPVLSGWSQGLSCTLKCFEHPFQKPDLTVAIVTLDSQNIISNMYAPTGASALTLDLTNAVDVANFETLLRNIFGPQVIVTAAYPPSGNVILTINYVYTDQISFQMALGSSHIMSEIVCP